MRTTRRAALAATLLGSAFLIAACGGGTATVGPDGATPPAGATPAAGTTPVPTSAATDAASPSAAIALPSFDLSGLVANLDGVDSYR